MIMVLFGNSWALINGRSFNNSMPAQTAFQLLVAAFNDKAFASILLNHADSIHEYSKEHQLRFNSECVDGVDFDALYAMNEHSTMCALLRQEEDQVFTHAVDALTSRDKDFWLCSEYVLKKLVDVVFVLAHLENMVLKTDGSTNQSMAVLNAESYTTLAADLAAALSFASICVDEEFEPQGMKLMQDLSESVEYLSDNAIQGTMTLERSRLMMAFVNMLTRIAVDYTQGKQGGIFKKTRSVKLSYAEKQMYNEANKHKNSDHGEVGTVEMPEYLFSPALPFSKPTRGGLHGFIDLDTLSGGDKAQIGAYIAYTLNDRCSCEHDCCGCLIENYGAYKMSDKWAYVSYSASQNF